MRRSPHASDHLGPTPIVTKSSAGGQPSMDCPYCSFFPPSVTSSKKAPASRLRKSTSAGSNPPADACPLTVRRTLPTSRRAMLGRITAGPLALLFETRNMSPVEGRPISKAVRSRSPAARCGGSSPGSAQKFLSTHAAVYNTSNVQRHLTSAQTHRTLRATAIDTWQSQRPNNS
jgi:hypothetical protein